MRPAARAIRPPSPALSLPAQRQTTRLRQPAARPGGAALLPPPLPPPCGLRSPPRRSPSTPRNPPFYPARGRLSRHRSSARCRQRHRRRLLQHPALGAALDAAAAAAAAPPPPPPPPGPSRDLRGSPAPGAHRPRPSRRPQPTARGLPPERPPRASGGGLSLLSPVLLVASCPCSLFPAPERRLLLRLLPELWRSPRTWRTALAKEVAERRELTGLTEISLCSTQGG